MGSMIKNHAMTKIQKFWNTQYLYVSPHLYFQNIFLCFYLNTFHIAVQCMSYFKLCIYIFP